MQNVMPENAFICFTTFLVLSVIVLLYTEKEIIVKNNLIKLLHNESIYSDRTKQRRGRQFDIV